MIDALTLARFMFQRQAEDYGATAESIEEAWSDPDVRAFWAAEAAAVLEFQGFAEAVGE